MRYYYCQQLGTYYKIGNEDRKKKIYGFESDKRIWVEIPIIKSEVGTGVYEYTLDIGMENTRAILREPDVHQTINYLMLELSASGNIQFLQFHPVSVEQIKRMKPELLADSETFIKPYPPHRQTLGSTQTFFSENKKYELSGEQRKALEAHRAHLQARWTEYHILSYLFFCFSRGYSRTEKIQEINNLLATGEAKAEVVEQGHTGSIVLGMR